MSFSGLIGALRAVKEREGSLEAVPAMFWERDTWGSDFFLELTKFHWSAIAFMPADEITEEIAREAVSQDANALRSVPIVLRSLQLCLEATERSIGILDAVPPELACELLNRWLRESADASEWNAIPTSFRTDEFTLRALEANPLTIEQIPAKNHTQAMCDAFLRGGGHDHFLEDVGVEARSRILCISCLKQGRGPLDAVPRLLWGPDIVEADRIGQSQDDQLPDS